MKCAKCEEPSVIQQGHQKLCERHYRFASMRSGAKKANKYVPSHEELEVLFDPEMICPDCKVKMNWRAKDGRSTVATLQHYRDGTLGIVCLSCNTRHAFMPEDTYREMPKDHKYCPKCKSIKHENDFYLDAHRQGVLKRKSYCNKCSDESYKKWVEQNREKYNQRQREYRARRKENGNPVTRKS